MTGPDPAIVRADAARALAEDIGPGDLTAALVPAGRRVRAHIVAKESGVLCGRDWAEACFRALDPGVRLDWQRRDGELLTAGDVLVRLEGDARAVLSAERSALNFLQLLSGTATATRRYAEALANTRTRVLDTRKTIPGLRHAQKYAVRCGGGTNHRIGLYDAILVKENHIAAAGSIAAAVAAARAAGGRVMVEVEVEDLDELRQALAAGADRIMLDDFSPADARAAVAEAAGRCELEISGGVSLEDLPRIAATGVDFVSVGALTKHVRAIDLSLRVDGWIDEGSTH